MAERAADGPFKDLFDFAGRLDAQMVNKRQLENLVRAGAIRRHRPQPPRRPSTPSS